MYSYIGYGYIDNEQHQLLLSCKWADRYKCQIMRHMIFVGLEYRDVLTKVTIMHQKLYILCLHYAKCIVSMTSRMYRDDTMQKKLKTSRRHGEED